MSALMSWLTLLSMGTALFLAFVGLDEIADYFKGQR